MPQVRLHLFIAGRVQGVGFRYYACRKAADRDVTGWVRNMDDGRVEVEVQGDRSVVEEFIDRLREGTTTGCVARLDRQEIPPSPGETGFDIAY